MITFKQKVYVAILKDLGYSGERRADTVLGYFITERDASRVAIENAVQGENPDTTEKLIEIKIYENYSDYLTDLKESNVESAISKLNPEEIKALRRHFKKGQK